MNNAGDDPLNTQIGLMQMVESLNDLIWSDLVHYFVLVVYEYY